MKIINVDMIHAHDIYFANVTVSYSLSLVDEIYPLKKL